LESYQIYLWKHGKKQTITSSDLHTKIIQAVQHVTDRPRLFVDTQRVEEVLSTEDAWDLVYDSPKPIQVGSLELASLQRIVVPLTGDLAKAGADGGNIVLTQSSEGYWDIWITKDRW